MKPILSLILLAALAAGATFWILIGRDQDRPAPELAGEDVSVAEAPGRGNDRAGAASAGADAEQKAAALQTMFEAEALAAQGEIASAMERAAPLAASGDQEALALMGRLNVERTERKRQERVLWLAEQLAKAPEDSTAQRYAIMRELARLQPSNPDFARLRELYGELFVEELEEGLLSH
jgi:hypothetical protein